MKAWAAATIAICAILIGCSKEPEPTEQEITVKFQEPQVKTGALNISGEGTVQIKVSRLGDHAIDGEPTPPCVQGIVPVSTEVEFEGQGIGDADGQGGEECVDIPAADRHVVSIEFPLSELANAWTIGRGFRFNHLVMGQSFLIEVRVQAGDFCASLDFQAVLDSSDITLSGALWSVYECVGGHGEPEDPRDPGEVPPVNDPPVVENPEMQEMTISLTMPDRTDEHVGSFSAMFKKKNKIRQQNGEEIERWDDLPGEAVYVHEDQLGSHRVWTLTKRLKVDSTYRIALGAHGSCNGIAGSSVQFTVESGKTDLDLELVDWISTRMLCRDSGFFSIFVGMEFSELFRGMEVTGTLFPRLQARPAYHENCGEGEHQTMCSSSEQIIDNGGLLVLSGKVLGDGYIHVYVINKVSPGPYRYEIELPGQTSCFNFKKIEGQIEVGENMISLDHGAARSNIFSTCGEVPAGG